MKELLARIDAEGITEVILCTNPNIEGEATAMYLGRLISRSASGSRGSRADFPWVAIWSMPTSSPLAAPSKDAATSSPSEVSRSGD